MNPDRPCNPPNPLPKSVKVRSTCNACQQAKIRCSHEKPSCRRCQKQNIQCIYSMSRRLGRPAKKRDPPQDHASYRDDLAHLLQQPPTRKPRGPKRKPKTTDKARGKTTPVDSADRMLLDPVSFDEAMVDELAADSSGLQPSSFLASSKDSPLPAADTFDLSSDSWLQDFMSAQSTEFSQDRSVLDALGISSSRSDSLFASKDIARPFATSSSAAQDHASPAAAPYYPAAGNPLHLASEPGLDCDAPSADPASYTDYLKRDVLAFSQPLQTSMETFHGRPALADTTGSARLGGEYIAPADALKSTATAPTTTVTSGMPRTYQCQCHEQTVRELIKVNIWACRISSTGTIDSILSCQRLLQQLAETILQCGVCSKTGANLLMVVVVSIDSLVTALEAVISVENGLMEGLFSDFHDHHLHDYRQDLPASSSARRYKAGGFHFKAQVEACPLLVGGFCVAADEKFAFVLQVLHTRLSGLLSTIRRIRLCTREILDVPASRGKLVMVMETDRRLQLIMMKMKMLTRR